jgi:hypothetical protein
MSIRLGGSLALVLLTLEVVSFPVLSDSLIDTNKVLPFITPESTMRFKDNQRDTFPPLRDIIVEPSGTYHHKSKQVANTSSFTPSNSWWTEKKEDVSKRSLFSEKGWQRGQTTSKDVRSRFLSLVFQESSQPALDTKETSMASHPPRQQTTRCKQHASQGSLL